MLRFAVVGVFVAAGTLTACGGDEPARAELAEVCGQASPVRVLPLESDEYGRAVNVDTGSDRVLYLVRPLERPEPGSLTWVPGEVSSVWSAGPCGESPVEVATGVERVFAIDAWPGVVLGCERESGRVVRLDPDGGEEPRVLFPELSLEFGCEGSWTDHGVLSVESHMDGLATLWLWPYPADPDGEAGEPVALLTDHQFEGHDTRNTLVIAKSHAYALNAAKELLRIDLADRTEVLVAENVVDFELGGGESLLWQDATVTQDHEKYPEGQIFWREMPGDAAVPLVETALVYSMFPLNWVSEGLLQIGLGYVNVDSKRVFFLPEFDHVDLPADIWFSTRIEGDRWVVGSLWDNRHEILDLRTGERTGFFPREAAIVGREDDALTMLEVPRCCIDSDLRSEGPLWRAPLDGSSATRRAARATIYLRILSDGRVVTPVGADSDWLASLIVVDPDSQEELRIDDRVHLSSFDSLTIDDDGMLRYSVCDGERSGVYLAKLPDVARSRASGPARGDVVVYDVVEDAEGRRVPRPRALGERPGLTTRSLP